MDAPVLQVDALGKRYRLYNSPRERLLTLLGWPQAAPASHWALRDVNLTLQSGQCLGVVGDNGAGKSTLLKLLAGTLQASHGRVQRRGRVTAILELGAGFHPDFTGRENLIFGAGLIGLERAEIVPLSEEIIAFAELQDAIDRPVKTYSSGMAVRLAFALVTAVQPELLIVDEALAVGDQHFQKKSAQRIETFRRNGCTILFCSHSLYHVRQLCDRVLWLDHGQVRGLGETESVLAAYQDHVRLHDKKSVGASVPDSLTSSLPTPMPTPTPDQLPAWAIDLGRRAGLIDAHAVGLAPQSADSDVVELVGPDLVVEVQAMLLGDEHPSFGVMLEQLQGVGITSIATHAEQFVPRALHRQGGWTTWQVVLTFPNLPLHSGVYSLSFYLFDAHGVVVYDEWKDYIAFRWISPSLTPGLVRLPHRWS